MRKEASLEEWRELYEVAIKIKSLRPWEYLWDMDLITISLPEYEQPFYCSIMGRGGECFAIGTYDGFNAINDFFNIVESEDIPSEQMIRYQNNMMCYFGNRDELTKKELQVIRDLGLKFRGKNEWIYFQSFMKGYAPYILDGGQVVKLKLVLRQLFMALNAIIEKRLEVNFEKGNSLFRRYDDEKGLWLTFEAPIIIPPRQYMMPVLEDDLLVARLHKQKPTKDEIEIDTLFLNTVINDKKFDRPLLPKMLIIADHKSGMIIDQNMLLPEDDEVQEIIGSVINYFLKIGKPKTIYVRDEYIESLLCDLCKRTNVSLMIKGNLKEIDAFARAFAYGGI